MFEQALSGVRVIDVTHYIARPNCGKLLAEAGYPGGFNLKASGVAGGSSSIGTYLKATIRFWRKIGINQSLFPSATRL